MNPKEIKNNFGKRYVRPITPFRAWWSGGVGTHDMPKSHIAADAWNACLSAAKDRLRELGMDEAADELDYLEEEQ